MEFESSFFAAHPAEDGGQEPGQGGNFPFSLDKPGVVGDIFGNIAEEGMQSPGSFDNLFHWGVLSVKKVSFCNSYCYYEGLPLSGK